MARSSEDALDASQRSSPSAARARTLPLAASSPTLALDAVDRLLAERDQRRKQLHEAAREEREKQQKLRLAERKRLTASMQEERELYVLQLGRAMRARRARSEAKLQASPLNTSLLERYEECERRRETTEYHDEIVQDRIFKTTMNRTFTKRVAIGDPFAELRAESRALLEQERQLRAQMLAEKSRERQEAAERRRPDRTEEFFERRKAREDEATMKVEFLRSLAGWDGRKVKTRSKPVLELWREHRAKVMAAGQAAADLASLPAPAEEVDQEAPEDAAVPEPTTPTPAASAAAPGGGGDGGDGFVFVAGEESAAAGEVLTAALAAGSS